MTGTVLVTPEALSATVTALYVRAGMPRAHARHVASLQTATDMLGNQTHGTRLAPGYVAKLIDGRLNPRPKVAIRGRSKAAIGFDADRALGPVAASVAMGLAVRTARDAGVAMVSVTNAGHFGAIGMYALSATEAGMVGLAACHTGSPCVAPFGSDQAVLGNSPFAVAIPTGDSMPVVLDMAVGAMSWGRIAAHGRQGEPIDEDVALDALGRATRRPSEAATLLPFGGAKGGGLAIAVEMLVGIVSRMDPQESSSEGRSGLFCAIDPSAFGVSPSRATSYVNDLADQVRRARPRDSQHVRVPGDAKWSARRSASARGLALDSDHLGELARTATRLNVEVPAAWHNS
jgi:LDH2 family malate/lactate/ureidoglycolate dehydrogenase